MALDRGRFVSNPVGALAATSSQRGFSSRNVAAAGATGFSPLHLPNLAVWIDPSDASTATISASAGAYIGDAGLVLGGSGTNHAVTIDVAAVRPTGDFTLVADVTATDWTPAAAVHIASSGNTSTTANTNWHLYLDTSGNVVLSRPTGSTARTYTSTVATGVSDGTRKKIKATFDQDNGASASEVRFYLSDDGTNWSQLGDAVTNASTAAGNSNTTAPRFGLDSSNVANFTGTIHRVALWSDLTSTTKVLDVDFDAATPYVSTFTGAALGMPVYVVSSTATSATATYSYVGPNGLVMPGTGANYASAPDINAYDATAEAEIVVRASLVDWTPAAVCTLLSHINASTGLRLDVHTDGTLKLVTNAATSTSTVANSFTDGAAYWLKATYSDAADEVKFFWAADAEAEPTSWTQLGTTVTQTSALSASTSALFVGCAASNSQVCAGTVIRAVLRSTIGGSAVFDANFQNAPDYATSFVESSANAATVTITATNTPANAAGAIVSQLNDKSGYGRNLTQSTASSMPKLWHGRNGRTCIVFDNSNDSIGNVDWTGLTQNVLMAAFARTNDTTNSKIIAEFGNNIYAMWSDSSERLNQYIGAGGVTSAGSMNTAVGSSCITDSSAVLGRCWLDGVQTTGSTNAASSGGTLNVGRVISVGQYPFSGELGDIVISLTIPPIGVVYATHNWLKAKWSTP